MTEPIIPSLPDFPGLPGEAPEPQQQPSLTAVETLTGREGPLVAQQPAWHSPLLTAHARNSWMGSIASSEGLYERLFPSDTTPMDTEQLIQALTRDQLWGQEDHFLDVRTVGQYNARRLDIEREAQDRQVMADVGLLTNFGTGAVVSFMDPTNWIPMKRALTFAHAGVGLTGALRAGAVTAGLFGGIALAQEPILQGTQVLRTYQEGVESVAAATILGGLIGLAPRVPALTVAGYNRVTRDFQNYMYTPNYNQVVRDRASIAYDAINDEIANNPAGRRVAGGTRLPSVAQVRERTEAFDALTAAEDRLQAYRDSSLFGWRAPWDSEWAPGRRGPAEVFRTAPQRLLGRLFGPGWQDPMDYVMRRSNSVLAREAMQNLQEVTLLLNKNVVEGAGHTGTAQPGKNIPTLQAAQSDLAQFQGGWSKFHNEMWGGGITDVGKRTFGRGDTLYVQARAHGFTGGMEDFDRAVFRAVVNGHNDPLGNPAVTKAAQRYEALVSKPIREYGRAAGYEIPDTPRYALGHAPRNWIIDTVRGADGTGVAFRQMVGRAYYNDLVIQAVQKNKGVAVTNQVLGQIERKAQTMAREAFDNVTGANFVDGGFRLTDQQATKASPFRERVIPVADDYLVNNGWIDGRITDVANHQVRTVVPQMTLGNRFRTAAGDPDAGMHSLFQRIDREYNVLAQGEVAKGARPGTPSAVSNADQAKALMQEKANVIQILTSVRDGYLMGPGFHGEGYQSNKWRVLERAVFMTKSFEAMRLMGNILVNSLPDTSNLVVRNGIGRTMRTMFNDINRAGVFDNTRFAGVDKQVLHEEAVRWGAATEWSAMSGTAARSDQLSPFAASNITTMERYMQATSRAFSITNLSLTWNEKIRTMAYRAGMDRVLTVAERGWANVPERDRLSMVQLGLGEGEINRIGAAWRSQNAQLNDGYLRFAHVTSWDDAGARNLLTAALEKDNASTVVRTKSGDFNTTAKNNPIANIVLQFQNFIFSHAARVTSLAEQRLIADGFYGRDSLRVYAGMISAVGMGMLSAYLLALGRDWATPVASGQRPRAEVLTNNFGQWLSTAIDKSGVTGLFGNINMQLERMGAPGMTSGLQAAFNDPSRALVDAGRLRAQEQGRARVGLGIATGPAGSNIFDMADTGIQTVNHFISGRPFRRSDARTLTETFPFQNHLIARKFIFEPSRRWLSQDVMGLMDR